MVVIRQITATQGLETGSAPRVQVDTSIVQGLASFGQALGTAARSQEQESLRFAQMEQQRENFAADQNLRALDAEIEAGVFQLQQKIDPSGAGHLEAVQKLVSDKYSAFEGKLPQRLQQEMGPRLEASAQVWSSGAVKQTVAQQQVWYQTGVDRVLQDNASSVAANPALLPDAIADVENAIAASGLYPIAAQQTRERAVIELTRQEAETRLTVEAPSLMADLGITSPETRESYFAAIRSAESGGNDSAANPNSSATGRYQFTAGTWAGLVARYPEAGLSLEGRLDGKQQEIAIRLFTKENENTLGNAGINSSNANLYAAHFLGAGDAVKVLGASDNALVSSIVPTGVVTANPFLAGMTVQDFKSWTARKAGNLGGAVDPKYSVLPVDVRRQLYDRAAVATQANIATAVENAPVAIASTGSYTAPMPSAMDFITAYGPQDGAARYQSFQTAVEVADASYDMRSMPVADIMAMVEAARPQSAGNDAAIEATKYETLAKAADETIKARNADPASYAAQVVPEVSQAWEAAQQSGGEAYQRALTVTQTAQERLGITQPVLLPKAMATTAVAEFKNAEASETVRAGSVASLMLGATGEQQRAIYRQLVDAGLPEYTAGAFDALERGDQGAAQRLFQAALFDPSKLPGKAPETADRIKEAIQSNLMSPGAVGDLFYGLANGDALNFERAAQDQTLISNAVELRLRQGESLDQAVQAVGKDLFGDVQPFEGRNVSVLLEAGTDTGTVQTGFEQLLPRVRESMLATNAVPPDASVADSSKAIFTAAQSNQIEAIVAEGYFRNAGDGFVFIDPFDGVAVEGPDGLPLVFTMDDVMGAAGSAPAPVNPMEAERLWLERQSSTFGAFGGAAAGQ